MLPRKSVVVTTTAVLTPRAPPAVGAGAASTVPRSASMLPSIAFISGRYSVGIACTNHQGRVAARKPSYTSCFGSV